MKIQIGSIDDPKVQALLSAHLESMHAYSPPESIHALSTEELQDPSITLWCAWDDGDLMGCGVLKALEEGHGEIKSMRTAEAYLRKGVAEAILEHIIQEARTRGYRRLSLETGSDEAFVPAQRLYQKHGFDFCEPFGSYVLDPYSVFMTREF